MRKGSFGHVNVPVDLWYSTDHEWVRKLDDGSHSTNSFCCNSLYYYVVKIGKEDLRGFP